MYTVQGNSGYLALFRISQNLPKHSAATRAATWSQTTSAVCGDQKTPGNGTVVTWISPVPLQYLPSLTVETFEQGDGHMEVGNPLSFLMDGPGLVDWRCSMHNPLRKAVDYTLTGRQTECCLSHSDTVVLSLSLIFLPLTGFNHSLCFLFFSF